MILLFGRRVRTKETCPSSVLPCGFSTTGHAGAAPSGPREAERTAVLPVTTTKTSTGRIEVFRLPSKIALSYVSPHGQAFPHRFLSKFVSRQEERAREKIEIIGWPAPFRISNPQEIGAPSLSNRRKI